MRCWGSRQLLGWGDGMWVYTSTSTSVGREAGESVARRLGEVGVPYKAFLSFVTIAWESASGKAA